MNLSKQIAKRLSEHLSTNGISQSQFGRVVKQHRPVITKWLSGKHNFTLNTIDRIEKRAKIQLITIPEY